MHKKVAILKIYEDPDKDSTDLQTGGVSTLIIMDALNALMGILARQLLEDAERHVGKDPEAQAKWVDAQRQKPNMN